MAFPVAARLRDHEPSITVSKKTIDTRSVEGCSPQFPPFLSPNYLFSTTEKASTMVNSPHGGVLKVPGHVMGCDA
jgi:hypothetical protein